MKKLKVTNLLLLVFAFALSAQWIIISRFHPENPFHNTILAGLCIFSSAFILSWAAELSQFYMSKSLAFILLALIAVLPEYTVDMYFAWTAGKNPEYIAYAAANMTGGNRLLVGFGWPLIVILFWLKFKNKSILLDKSMKLELGVLLAATLYSFTIPLKGSLSIVDTIILTSLFVFYFIRASRLGISEPEIEEGPVEILCRLPSAIKLFVTIFFFLFSGYAIFISAEPFSEGLLKIGEVTGIDKFILVQWIAPLASEAPEIIVTIIFTLKGLPKEGLRALVSSKINQWTLLVGMLPLIYSISLGKISTMHLDIRQIEEILLTACQSVFALIVIFDLRFTLYEGFILLGLFSIQLFFPSTTFRLFFSGIYIILSLIVLVYRKKTKNTISA